MKDQEYIELLEAGFKEVIEYKNTYRTITTILSIMLLVSITYNVYLERKIDNKALQCER
jgi:hypothetical protein